MFEFICFQVRIEVVAEFSHRRLTEKKKKEIGRQDMQVDVYDDDNILCLKFAILYYILQYFTPPDKRSINNLCLPGLSLKTK